MVLFDTDFLLFLLSDNPGSVLDPLSKKPVEAVKEKIEYLISRLSASGQKIIVTTPSLSELLCFAFDDPQQVLTSLTGNYRFRIEAFDTIAAIEAAVMTADAIARKDKKAGLRASWQKVKVDRQIVAIAKTRKVDAVYSNDHDIRALAERENLTVHSVWSLSNPPPRQTEMDTEGDASSTTK